MALRGMCLLNIERRGGVRFWDYPSTCVQNHPSDVIPKINYFCDNNYGGVK